MEKRFQENKCMKQGKIKKKQAKKNMQISLKNAKRHVTRKCKQMCS